MVPLANAIGTSLKEPVAVRVVPFVCPRKVETNIMPLVESLSKSQFERIASIAKERWGLSLGANKIQLVTSRVTTFLRKSTYSSVDQYLHHIEDHADQKDLLVFFDLLSTNVTSFFRDRGHYDYLERELFTAIARGNITLPGKKLRLWSAGCSTGCEPYTLAMVVSEFTRELSGWDIQILATDLSNYAVEEARKGAYAADVIKDLPKELLARHFTKSGDLWEVKPHLRDMVRVGQLNLMEKWPMRGPFDVIFCRNVMIYFDGPTRERLVNRFASLLRPGGIFAVGSAETLAGMNVPLRSAMPSLYVK
jgi:chemotaxis protein methyltransferase CheR